MFNSGIIMQEKNTRKSNTAQTEGSAAQGQNRYVRGDFYQEVREEQGRKQPVLETIVELPDSDDEQQNTLGL